MTEIAIPPKFMELVLLCLNSSFQTVKGITYCVNHFHQFPELMKNKKKEFLESLESSDQFSLRMFTEVEVKLTLDALVSQKKVRSQTSEVCGWVEYALATPDAAIVPDEPFKSFQTNKLQANIRALNPSRSVADTPP